MVAVGMCVCVKQPSKQTGTHTVSDKGKEYALEEKTKRAVMAAAAANGWASYLFGWTVSLHLSLCLNFLQVCLFASFANHCNAWKWKLITRTDGKQWNVSWFSGCLPASMCGQFYSNAVLFCCFLTGLSPESSQLWGWTEEKERKRSAPEARWQVDVRCVPSERSICACFYSQY